MLHILIDALRNSILITGLVIIMMLAIEYINIASGGKWFRKIQNKSINQVALGAILGIVPGCMGGFATVSLYTHKMISFGALIAMMIASSGDEAFVLLATIPDKALILFAILFIVAIVAGLLVDKFYKPKKLSNFNCNDEFKIHNEIEFEKGSLKNLKSASPQRIALLISISLFIIALVAGLFEHSHSIELGGLTEEASHSEIHHSHHHHSFNILNEYWLNLIFAALSLFILYFIATTSEHIVKEHLWSHVIKKHLLTIFLWSFGALLVIGVGLNYLDFGSWAEENIPLLMLIAILIGLIPESGPHLIFITLYASGVIPFSVLLASSISQDGHASLPLLAESKKSFLYAKIVNCIVAAIAGYTLMILGL